MNYVVTAQEMKRADRNTVDYYGIPELVLMENAARETARFILGKYPEKCRVLVLAGGGNNGGDGMAAGRILFQQGYSVTVFFCAPEGHVSESAARQMLILRKYGVPVTDHFPDTEYDIIIDAVLGTGLTREVSGLYAEILKRANALHACKIACDVPSGIDSGAGRKMGEAFRADVTLTYGYLKRGLVLYPGAEYAGKVICLDIGISEHSFLEETPVFFTYEAGPPDRVRRRIYDLLPERPADGHKGSFGKVLLIAGSKNMSGACVLAAKALYRTGTGMVRILTVEENRGVLQRKVPEAILHTYRTGQTGLKQEDRVRRVLEEDIAWADCIVAGCGLSAEPPAVRLMELALEETESELCGESEGRKRSMKLLLDADALNIMAKNETVRGRVKRLAGRRCEIAFTPHLLEFARISGLTPEEIRRDPAGCCIRFTREWGVTTVCKDARTIVGLTDGKGYINRTGNSGMATAGSGDVLSGVIGALAAQGMELSRAAVLGVYLHGAAGDAAAEECGEYATMARDLVRQLKKLVR